MSFWSQWLHGSGVTESSLPTTVTSPIVFSEFIEQNQRFGDEQMSGGFYNVVDADTLANGDSIVYTHGLGKLFIVINAGADISGTLTITGTQVDRNTGAEIAAFAENITIDALTTDNSDTDTEGNVRHAFVGAYMSSNWFKGSLTISTTDLNISDIDIWNIMFEQVNDTPSVTLQTFDCSLLCTNTDGWFYAYLYLVDVDTTTKKVDLSREASLELSAADSAANVAYRLRKGNLAKSFNGTSDGVWMEIHFGPVNQNYFQNITIKSWFDIISDLT